uniref:Putative secreted protein n=1 Tax=Amblyomma parvum TaxID=251391 RepID=A0A023G1I8_AMBPA
MPNVRTVLLVLVLGSWSAARRKNCDGKFFAKWLGYNPDAWKIIANGHAKYHLMSYSNGSLPKLDKCLSTTKSSKHGNKWERIVTYHSFFNSTVYHGTTRVSTEKSDEFFVYDNSLNASYSKKLSDSHYEPLFSINDVIFMEENKCIVLKSDLFGYEVWVHTSYLIATGRIPYFCIFFYEACAGRDKIWAYDWNQCPITTHNLAKTANT